MKKIFTLAGIVLFLTGTQSFAQTNKSKDEYSPKNKKGNSPYTKWTTNPFDKQVFIENKGQFDGIIPGNPKIYYVVRMGEIQAFFTSKGIIYRSKKYPTVDLSKGQDPDEGGPPKPIIKYLYSEWKDAKANLNTGGMEEQSYYYTYPQGMSGTIKTNVFKKIIYRNLYPGIDVEYSLKNGKPGIEYQLIVHPGANISNARLLYSGDVTSELNPNGDIEAQTKMGMFTMTSPEAFYQENNEPLQVSYQLNGNEESFSVKNVDVTKAYVIDPWVTDPLFTSVDRGYSIDFDYAGDVYVYGGDGSPYQLVKLNSTGSIIWVFNATTLTSSTSYYGDLATDRVNGTCYLTEGWNASAGARVEKVNTLGTLVATYPGDINFSEMYKAAYDACNRDIIIGGGGTTYPYQACVLDTSMITETPVNIEGVTTGYHDIALLAIDPQGDTCYMATTQSLVYFGVQNNYLIKLPLPSLTPSVLDRPDSLSFHEIGSVFYVAPGVGTANGFNGMAASPKWLYLYNGDTLRQVNKVTGFTNKILPLNPNLYNYHWGGLDVDEFDDIYVGFRDSVKVYNSTLSPEDSFALPAASDTIFALRLGIKNIVYATGIGFVMADTIPAPPRLISTATGNPTSCSVCNGSASVTLNGGITPFSFSWSNGSTNQMDTGLCAGVYTITVTDASCPPRVDTAIVTIPGEAGFTASAVDTNPNCALSKGNITAMASGGSPPYTYSWSNGETTQKDTGLVAGTYVCTITDSSGCRYNISVTLVNPVTPTITIVPHNDSICSGTNLPMTASGVSTYTWTPTTGLSCYNCPSPTASPTATTTYTVMGADSNGCSASATTTIKVYTTPQPMITGKDSICSGNTDTLSVTGGTTYTWSTGATTSTISITVTSSQTVTVTAHNGICTHDTTFAITDVSTAARITASKDSTCSGDTVKLTGSGGVSYLWSTSSTNPIIIVSPTIPTTYTLYTAYGTCTDSAVVRIGIIKQTAATLHTSTDSVCPGTNVVLSATLTSGTGTFKWNTGSSTSSITVNDSVSTTYTATVYGKCDTVSYVITNNVVPLPKPSITGPMWKCKGDKDTLTVSGGTTYLWSNGSTKSTYTTGDIDADSTIYVIAYNSLGCAGDTVHFPIAERTAPVITIPKPPLACTNAPVVIVPTVTGTGPYTFLWSTGATTDSISVPSPTDSATVVYTVAVSNGCISTKTISITAEYPTLNTITTQTVTLINDTLSPSYATLWATGNSTVYYWQDSILVTCIDPSVCDTVRVSPTVTTTYTVTGFDKAGCSVTGYVTVIVDEPCFDYKVPNVFTPNYPGPYGRDNKFYVETKNIDGWSITIFDRWGKEMYTSSDVHQYWDGTNKSGDQVADGVYYYIITGVCQNNTYKKEGFVQLIR